MAIKLPERNSFTFAELMERWQCTENDVRHLIIEKTLVPSYFFQGLARLVCWEGDKKLGCVMSSTVLMKRVTRK